MNLKDRLTTFISYYKNPAKRKLIELCRNFKGKNGLEIGGPSSLFSLKGYFPVYLYAGKIDGVNYSENTAWEGRIKEGENYHYYNKTGYQFIREATDLAGMADESYDFVLSCHSLEHVANPLRAIAEWKRVLKKDGYIVLVLPDKRYTFDIKRPYTLMEHLLKDYEMGTDESDTTHFEEIISLHELNKDEKLDSRDMLQQRLKENKVHRFAHHHVFNFDVLRQILTYFSFTPVYEQAATPFHLIVIAQKKV
jgi:ubiquinone/menaquinone biosynthesis C-methylase UbiE